MGFYVSFKRALIDRSIVMLEYDERICHSGRLCSHAIHLVYQHQSVCRFLISIV